MPTATPEQHAVSNDTVIDLLDRQPFIDQLLQIAETLSKKRKNACYALNGAWGVGKSFVINEFEKQIAQYGQEDTTLSRFLLFHYDCWKYDYYAEPLTAIISVMLETIERDVHLLSDDTKRRIISTLKAIGIYALDHFDKRLERNIGLSPKKIYEAIAHNEEELLNKISESHDYDSYYAIKITLQRLRDAISQLSQYQTILLVVDELDRCLPEYTIKVLERLHHVFEGIPNVQIILATDKNQLGHVVQQIYGSETSIEKYLGKFIQFELSLGEGTINNNFSQLFSAYMSFFAPDPHYGYDKFIETLLRGVDTRTRISIINRCELVHSFLPQEHSTKLTTAHMCAEIFLTTIKHYKVKLSSPYNWPTDPLSTEGLQPKNLHLPNRSGLNALNQLWITNNKKYCYTAEDFKEIYIQTIEGLILACYWYICGLPDVYWARCPLHINQTHFESYIENFWNLLSIIH